MIIRRPRVLLTYERTSIGRTGRGYTRRNLATKYGYRLWTRFS